MRLFLDSSVLLAASGSIAGASHEIFRLAADHDWILITTPYVVDEVNLNIQGLTESFLTRWAQLRPRLSLMQDILTPDRPVVFEPAKDRPILFGALAWADILLTLDRGDFGALMNRPFYGLMISTPGAFLESERAAGRLK